MTTILRDLPQPAALLFDLDGTLVDTVGTRIEAWLATFAEAGINAEREHVAGLIGADGKLLAKEVAHRAGATLTEPQAERIDHRAGEHYDRLNLAPRPTSGARELLSALDASPLTWAIATSSRPEQTRVSVAALGLDHDPRLVDGSHVEHAKPAPDLLLTAAAELGVAPTGCWYVGDSRWDMLAARAAGMTAIGVPYGAAVADDLLAAGAGTVTTLTELLTELRRRGLLAA